MTSMEFSFLCLWTAAMLLLGAFMGRWDMLRSMGMTWKDYLKRYG